MAEAVHELPHVVEGGKVQARDGVALSDERRHLQLLVALLFMAK